MSWLLQKLLKLWVRATAQPAELPRALLDPSQAVCFVFDRDSAADLAVLLNAAERMGMPARTGGPAGCRPISGARTSTWAGAAVSGMPPTRAVRRPISWRSSSGCAPGLAAI